MKETDIRPADLIELSKKLYAEDIRKILVAKNDFVRVDCPACESAHSHFAFEKSGFSYERCVDCRTLYVSPRPTMEMLGEHYQTSLMYDYWSENIYPVSEDVRRKSIFAPRALRAVELCKQHGLNGGLILDIGAGFGTFLQEVDRIGFFEKCLAVEPTPKLAEACRKKGLLVQEELAENLKLESPADVITNFELIEHLFRPVEFLEQCHRLLKPGGLLLLTTPNILGFDLLVLGAASDNIAAPNHINYFHPGSLRIIMKRAGFEVIETLTPGELDVDIVQNKIRAGEFQVTDQPFLQEILVERGDSIKREFQRFLAENQMSSHLWVVARRI